MPKYECLKCHRVFYGWAKKDKCPNCGGKLQEVHSGNRKYPDNRKYQKVIDQS